MAVIKRENREIVDTGIVICEITPDEIGEVVDFAGIIAPFRVIDANVTVEEAFANADNTIKIGIEGDDARFIASTAMNSLASAGFTNKQYTATKPTAIIATVAGTASATGKAVVTITYAKTAYSRVEY